MYHRPRPGLGLLLALAASAQVWAADAQRSKLNMPVGVTEVSRKVHDVHMLILWICVVIGAIVFLVMFYSIFSHRKSRGHKAANFHENTALEMAWTPIPSTILIRMSVPATSTLLYHYHNDASDPDSLLTGSH